ncbi:MAG TPA: glycosyl transferase family protein, partial [Bryobacteraceae bacterium]|nr:glycosyl transferase family protein [Bryobacteraceae bacterium]
AAALVPLGVWLLLSGIDDLFVDLWWLARCRARHLPARCNSPERLIAIFVPLWREEAVIAGMIEHNRAAIDYARYHFFLGIYPNDEPTLEAVRELEAEHACVHVALCPHDGPTSKADCLNWIYQRMQLYEEEQGARFDIILIHDAEDLIHSQGPRAVNELLTSCDMVQVPVLALPTPFGELTHGVYCDEFAEYQMRDMPARQSMGAFIPSCGVGTGYRREVLDRLAEHSQNRIFEPACLTEDYENGLRLHGLGARQAVVPIARAGTTWLATREYFPRNFQSALVQRIRWVTGNVLQSWERHGWRGDLVQKYWLWRDRKSIVGSLVTAATNLAALYGLATLAGCAMAGAQWKLPAVCAALVPAWMLQATTLLLLWRIALRMWFAGLIYGAVFALGVPVRALCANALNSVAAIAAIVRFAQAKWRGEPLRWVKTAHNYPSREALSEHKRPLRDILIGAAYAEESEIEAALASKPGGVELTDHLVAAGILSEDDLVEVLSLREGLPIAAVQAHEIPRRTGRALPARVVRQWQVLPFQIETGTLYVAAPRLPADGVQDELRRFTSLRIRLHLMARGDWEALVEQVL